eukprot:gene16990-biopygen10635
MVVKSSGGLRSPLADFGGLGGPAGRLADWRTLAGGLWRTGGLLADFWWAPGSEQPIKTGSGFSGFPVSGFFRFSRFPVLNWMQPCLPPHARVRTVSSVFLATPREGHSSSVSSSCHPMRGFQGGLDGADWCGDGDTLPRRHCAFFPFTGVPAFARVRNTVLRHWGAQEQTIPRSHQGLCPPVGRPELGGWRAGTQALRRPSIYRAMIHGCQVRHRTAKSASPPASPPEVRQSPPKSATTNNNRHNKNNNNDNNKNDRNNMSNTKNNNNKNNNDDDNNGNANDDNDNDDDNDNNNSNNDDDDDQ